MNKKYWQNKNVLITGGAGFLGSHLANQIKKINPAKIIIPRSKNYDLREKDVCLNITKNIDIAIHLAANVGGIGYNKKYPASLFYDNLIMSTFMMEAARMNGVRKYVSLGTVCSYPKHTPIPFKEINLWNGYPEENNAPYGLAKKMQLVQSQVYRRQHNFNSIYLLPVNLYGPGDNFNPKSSHVIPALIKKFIDAKEKGIEKVFIWGTGTPTREFLYVEDAVRGIILATERYDKSEPVNLGSHFEISIKDLANTIKKISGFKGKIEFDSSKTDGQQRRKLDVSKAKKEFDFESKISFEDGLKKTIKWYQSQT
ncbi:MAG: GDP-L-fucose synthase [Candidatus Pacebacteria bacterium]|jgi:GDP-L-fucose synthase|nr:GDP-L-fucose synthase [Candidatus Paceibacterota bacterium]MBT4004755.1 GDP-L-fucose synthase [Candidatus Paceibacterota bacterium]MBT6899254.1 GDP-L-fucose synthase [Candidatus Paceibacterota bacterium]MBT7184154.1 GDP-L-fucose synthase [Candidatus Paceibacterota bacterium]MBT7310014.1 GDP-L-fucose synthase [Candidatus Paceibacterota bacterium]